MVLLIILSATSSSFESSSSESSSISLVFLRNLTFFVGLVILRLRLLANTSIVKTSETDEDVGGVNGLVSMVGVNGLVSMVADSLGNTSMSLLLMVGRGVSKLSLTDNTKSSTLKSSLFNVFSSD